MTAQDERKGLLGAMPGLRYRCDPAYVWYPFDDSDGGLEQRLFVAISSTQHSVVVGFAEEGDITGGTEFIQEGTFTSEVRTDVLDREIQRSLSVPIERGLLIRVDPFDVQGDVGDQTIRVLR